MKTILIYKPEKALSGFRGVQQVMIEYLREQGIRFERNQDHSIIIGETKILFYDAGKRNDKVFVRTHPIIDSVFYCSHMLNSVKDDNFVFKAFCEGKEILVLSNYYNQAFCELAKEIDEIEKQEMFLYEASKPSVEVTDVPVGLNVFSHFPLSERDGVIKIMAMHLEHQTSKVEQIEKQLQIEKEKAERIIQNIGRLKESS